VSLITPGATSCRNTEEALSLWSALSGAAFPPTPDQGTQRVWDKPLLAPHHKLLLENAVDQKSTARLLGASTKESGKWLQVLPCPSLGTLLDRESLRIAVALRLGAPMCRPHKCRCGVEVDSLGHHGLSCRFSAGRLPRHSALNDTICRALLSAGVPSLREPVGVSRDDGKRPDGLTMIPWHSGKCLAWDATCVDPLAPTHLPYSSTTAAAAANKAEAKKVNKYRALRDNFLFVPLGFETIGAFGDSSLAFTAELGRRIRLNTGETRATEFLRQKISVDIQRGNAASILSSIPSARALEEVFYLF
jgi:hypothetical protein